MPCHEAIEKNNFTVSPNDPVEHVLSIIDKNSVRAAAVVDDNGEFLGIFSKKILLKNLIPVSVAMADDVQIDIKVQAAPGVAKRVHKVLPLPVYELMKRKPETVSPDDPIWEGVSKLTKSGEPLSVVDDRGKYLGFITYDSLLNTLLTINTVDL